MANAATAPSRGGHTHTHTHTHTHSAFTRLVCNDEINGTLKYVIHLNGGYKKDTDI